MTIIRSTWLFPYYTWTTAFPENSQGVSFGRGYTFVSQPSGPPQRSFKLNMRGMKWHRLTAGGYDLEPNRTLNLGRLMEFYRSVELWKPFIWQHPIEGNLLVRFLRPVIIPEQIEGGGGVVNPFQVEFIEMPTSLGVELIPDSEDSRLLVEDTGLLLLLENGIVMRAEQ